MGKIYELTPMELYFCGVQLKAKYLDYDYFRAMPDVQKNYLRHEQETLEQLEDKEIIEMDFSGNVSFNEEAQALLKPVYFGEKESRLDIPGKPSWRFHIMDHQITMSVMEDDVICLERFSEKKLEKFLAADTVEIHLSDVNRGSKSAVYTSGELEAEENKKTAIKLIKGEE